MTSILRAGAAAATLTVWHAALGAAPQPPAYRKPALTVEAP